jgi:hypothetical protein
VPGSEKLAVVSIMAAFPKVAVPGPDTFVHAVVKVPPGSPSSVTVASSEAVAGRVTVLSVPAFTVGAVLAAFTVNEKLVVLVTPPPVAETVTVELPAGVVGRVVTVMVVEQVGVQEAGAKLAVAPWGRPVAEKETACGVPETRVAEREAVTD